MAQQFYIKQHSINPTLRLELVNDAKYDFFKSNVYNYSIQNADIYFSMEDANGILCISKQPCNLILENDGTCEERYIIEYPWKDKDTKRKGQFVGYFLIDFKEDLIAPNNSSYLNNENNISGPDYPKGTLIMPVNEELQIFIL